MPSTSSVEVLTFGCRLNLVESEAIRRAALAAGRRDLIVVNTCAVTAEATRQARQAIRRARRAHPAAEIAVTGCAAQISPQLFAAMPEVDRLVGNATKTAAATWAAEAPRLREVQPIDDAASALETGCEDHTRAFLSVQNGCDHRCTFCIIPFGRGPSRSAPLADIVEEARRLATRGFQEIVLTGVDLTAYGRDLAGMPSLGMLAMAILRAVPDLPRLRLSSIDCIEADEALLDALTTEPRLMPHLHLSLQAGDDMILKRMKRRHTRADAVAFCTALRRARPGIAFGADLIAGFPTETDEMFDNTLKLVEDCGLTHLHVFPFSPRPGTPAAKMPAVASPIVKERARRLRAAGDEAVQRHLASQTGRTMRVLTERGGVARAEDFTLVRVGDVPPGRLVDVTIEGADDRALIGHPLS